jgi:NAD(P)H-flavin reductase
MLHGVRHADDLYYRALLESSAAQFVPCLTGPAPSALPSDTYKGRVTAYLRTRLITGEYDFYLAGRREMIADAMAIVDDRFPTSRVYTEIFF